MGSPDKSARFSGRGLSEIVGVIGVMVGLVFVGTEIHQNTLEFIERLSPEERFKVDLSTIALLTRLEGVYSQVVEGLIGEEALDYYGVVQPRFDEAGFWTIWGGARRTFSPAFRDFFEQRHEYSP